MSSVRDGRVILLHPKAAGTIYVLRSKSDHPAVAANRDLIHKIGVTNILFIFTAKMLTTIPCNNMKTKTDDPQFWSSRAEEVRVIAEGLKDGRRDLMLRIADDYDLLAGLTKSALVAPTR